MCNVSTPFELKELIEEKLPDIIREENQGHNDGTMLDAFAGVVLFKGSMPLPYVRLSVTGGERTEKDSIVQNTVYDVSIEIVLAKLADRWVVEARYREGNSSFMLFLYIHLVALLLF